jgi:ribosome maturation factor RimP
MGGVFQPIFFARSPFWRRGDKSVRSQDEQDLRAGGHQGRATPGQRKAPGKVRGTAAAPRESVAPGPVTPWRDTVAATVAGLGYELVDIERVPAGTLRVYIDRVPGREYPGGAGEFVTVDDCEQVTRQLQYALEVDAVAYTRLEVSSPGLDRPLRHEADFLRFAGHEVSLTLKAPFQGRKVWKGVLGRAEDGHGWCLALIERKAAGKADARTARRPGVGKAGKPGKAAQDGLVAEAAAQQVLGFTLDEVREARLVPVVDFKGRRSSDGGQVDALAADAGGEDS